MGIDTSTKFLCIGFFDNLKIFEYRLNLGRSQSCFLLPSIERILKSLGVKPYQIDYFAVGLGPGSFTGIRIGLSTIKGLAITLKKKVLGMSSLDIIAYNAIPKDNYKFICPVVDAKRGLIYTSLYRKQGDTIRKLKPYKLIPLSELVKMVPGETVFLGDALRLYKKTLMLRVKRARFLDEEFHYPKATNIIKIALERIKSRGLVDAKILKPIYLYPKECQVRK